ncbi:MAG: hypothetical protein WC732_01450 [Candidatus Omnitrophota bacterium]
MAEEAVIQSEQNTCCSRLSWGAIFAGTILVLLIEMALALLGMGIGLGAINPRDPSQMAAIGAGTVVWWIISGLIALFIGGMVTGRFSSAWTKSEGGMHGVIVLGMTTLIKVVFLATSLGVLLAGGMGLMGAGASGAGQAVSQGIEQFSPGGNINETLGLNETREGQTPKNIPEITKAAGDLLQDPTSQVKKDNLLSLLTRNTTMTRPQAEEKVNNLLRTRGMVVQKTRELGEKAKETAEGAGDVMGKTAIAGFFMLLLGAAAAYMGGFIGTPLYEEEPITRA